MYSAPYSAPYTSYYGGFSPFGFSPFNFFAPSIGVGVGYGGSSIFTFLLFGMLALFLVQTVGSAIASRSDGGVLGGGDAVSVMRLQVTFMSEAHCFLCASLPCIFLSFKPRCKQTDQALYLCINHAH